ncbi:cilia- and flagella-associated protein 97 isoform X3 [Labrus bergylta]|uniref:cilia- and flagella-associated protein 97 isoform X3 n=1 Tax=Labrus bergylta TaxID=56723 RepID=UPI0009B30406|nr:cilia- and flagella-associated protein 97-like isoform X2 [Labrus bergylta]
MLNPSELEGEVDHSFFDSDCDISRVSRDGRKNIEKCLKDEKENLPVHEELNKKQPDNIKGGVYPKTEGATKQLKPVESNRNDSAEAKETCCLSTEKERSRASSISSVSSSSAEVINDGSDGEEELDLRSKRPNGKCMSLLAEEVDVTDMNKQSPKQTGEETSSSAKLSGSIGGNKRSPKRRIRNRRTRSPSPTSTEASVDADSESSGSSLRGRSGLDPPTLSRPKKSLSPGGRSNQVGSAGSRNVPFYLTEVSEDSVTDVSPLSSSDSSPHRSLDLNQTESEEGRLTEQQQQHPQQLQEERVPSSGLSNTHEEEESDQDNDGYFFSSESQLGGKLVLPHPGARNRKNYSFTNDQVRCIDQENQRLLRELSRLSPGPSAGSSAGKKSHMYKNSPPIRLSHSALNRQREQQRIERENLAFLKRLESVKPTPGLKRSEQLADYQRQIEYLGGPSYPDFTSTMKESFTSKTPSGPRPVTSVHRSSRPVSTLADSRPHTRSNKPSSARPAWS